MTSKIQLKQIIKHSFAYLVSPESENYGSVLGRFISVVLTDFRYCFHIGSIQRQHFSDHHMNESYDFTLPIIHIDCINQLLGIIIILECNMNILK
jgi:uncharacterized protein with PQ loop repeat